MVLTPPDIGGGLTKVLSSDSPYASTIQKPESVRLSWEEGRSALFPAPSHTFHLEPRALLLCLVTKLLLQLNRQFPVPRVNSQLPFLISMSHSLPQIKPQRASEIKPGVNQNRTLDDQIGTSSICGQSDTLTNKVKHLNSFTQEQRNRLLQR